MTTEHLRFLKKIRRRRRMVVFLRILILFLFLLQWEICADTGVATSPRYCWGSSASRSKESPPFTAMHSPPFSAVSSPSRIITCFLKMTEDGSVFHHIGITLYETLVSFLLVTLASILIAILLWCFHGLSEILDPYMVVLNSLPKSALAPLLIVWLGANTTTIVVAGMSVAIFGSILNLYTSFSTIDQEKIRLIYTLHGKRRHALTKVVLPGSIPAIISNMKVNIGLCLVGVIIGEFLAARSGLGYLIIYSSQVFKLDWLLMSICILCIIAVLLYAIIGLIEKWYLKKTG